MFSEQYLTYAEYRVLGGTLPQAPFDLLEFEVRRQIDIRTQNRLKNISSEDIPNEVKLCEFKMINSTNIYYNSLDNVVSNGNIKSVNTDGYSESYVTASEISEIIKSKSAELDNIIENYLLYVVVNNEHIMYSGIK